MSTAPVGRPRTCSCGSCEKCKRRVYQQEWWSRLTPEERAVRVAARDREKVRRADRARASRNTTRGVPTIRRWRRANPEKVAAHNAVARAKRKGILVPGPCERGPEGCGPGKVHAHHDDYAKPLKVRWLCARHHAEERA
jgi:hypothetical protein